MITVHFFNMHKWNYSKKYDKNHGQQVQLNLVFWKLLIRRKKVRIMETTEKLRVDRARVKFGSN